MKSLYIEAWRPNLYHPNWAASTTEVQQSIYRRELGGEVGCFSMALWPCWYKLIGSIVIVTFVSNNSFSRDEAIQISADIIAEKVRKFEVDLRLI